MTNFKIDHLVIGCRNLQEGTDYIQNLFGLELSEIGCHKSIGTHNRVLKIGKIYLEVIALDPSSKVKKNNSFFGLSKDFVYEKIIKKPRLISFVISSNNKVFSEFYCKKKYMERGNYKWNFIKPNQKKFDQKTFPYIDVFPSKINWLSISPLFEMKDNTLSFDSLVVELAKDQVFYKQFLKQFNLKENIIFKVEEKQKVYNLPRLTAKIIDQRDGKEFVVS